MIKHYLLETDGYQVVFELKSMKEADEDVVDAIIEFRLDSRLGNLSIKSVPNFIYKKDLEDLIKYFENHIDSLQKDQFSTSEVFITYGLGFQIQAFAGEAISPEDGEFTISFVVNLGQADEDSSRTWIGGESVITFEKIRNFTKAIDEAISQLFNS